jgi:hypothetical protein
VLFRSAKYSSGESITLTATPASGYAFEYWLYDSGEVVNGSPAVISISANHTITAVFITA